MSDLENDSGVIPPWEQPGAVRRDCEPHRADLLAQLAALSRACAALSWLVCLPALIAMPLALVVWVLLNRDLRRMGDGLMEPAPPEVMDKILADVKTALLVSVTPAAVGLFFAYIEVVGRWP